MKLCFLPKKIGERDHFAHRDNCMLRARISFPIFPCHYDSFSHQAIKQSSDPRFSLQLLSEPIESLTRSTMFTKPYHACQTLGTSPAFSYVRHQLRSFSPNTHLKPFTQIY